MIITNNEELLRAKCDDVLPEEAGKIILALESELNYSNKLGISGVGLAAPQIGIAKNVAIIRFGKESLNLINCKITKQFDPRIFRQEGCLSFPGRVEDTTRFQEIVVSNNLLYPNNFIATGMLAIICQHELDHINGKLFFDRKIGQVKNRLKPNDLCNCGKLDLKTKMPLKFKKCCGRR
jgi:peptide deformylase